MSEDTTQETSEETTPQEPVAETPTEAPVETPIRMTAKIGRIDGALNEVGFIDGERVKELLEKANISFSKGMAITDDAGEDVDSMDNATDGAVYWISGNFENGQQ